MSESWQVEAPAALADELHRHGVDPGGLAQVRRNDLGQLQEIRLRQTQADLLDLGLDDVEVVEEPFRGGDDGFRGASIRFKRLVGMPQGLRVVGEVVVESPRSTPRVPGRREVRRQRLGERIEPFDTQ